MLNYCENYIEFSISSKKLKTNNMLISRIYKNIINIFYNNVSNFTYIYYILKQFILIIEI